MTVSTQSAARARPRRHPAAVWRDPSGRLSWLRIVTLAAMLVPLAIAIHDGLTVGFGPRPLNDVIHRTGYWALILLMVSLAITPLRRVGRFGMLLDVRRMIGVGAFVYAVAHILLYVADQKYDLLKVASEIVLRVYLTIGFIALLGLTALTVTSTDAMVRRLGARRWQMLHNGLYLFVLLAIVHYFQQNKADVWAPTLVAGLFVWLMGYRIVVRQKKSRGEPSAPALLGLTLLVAALTFLAEAVGIAIAFNTSPLRVLQTALELDWYTIRPGWFVLALGVVVVAVDLARSRWNGQRRRVSPARAAAPPAQG
jgi:sulfoxide reductase heme-binding subunit YedZ